MSMIDSIDEQLVRLLGQDARQNSETLAKKLHLSAATIRRRMRKLIQNDLLHIIGVVDPKNFGVPLIAMITIDISHDKLVSTVETLSKLPEISWISTSTGRYDVIAMAAFSSTDALSDFMTKELPKLEGVKDSETFICLDSSKGNYHPLS